MSCNFGVWYPDRCFTDARAIVRYERLCAGQVEGEGVEHPSIETFYTELANLHPEIADVPAGRIDDSEHSRRSVDMDRSDANLIMACKWSRAEEVPQLVLRLAEKHSLAVYDPQQVRVY